MNRKNIKHFLQDLVDLIDYFNDDLEKNSVEKNKLINYHNKSQFDDLLPRTVPNVSTPGFITECGLNSIQIDKILIPDLTDYENNLSEGNKEKGKVEANHVDALNDFNSKKIAYNQAKNANPADSAKVNKARKELYKAQKRLLNSDCASNYFSQLDTCSKTTQGCLDQAAKWMRDTSNGLTFSAGSGDGYTFIDDNDTNVKYYQDLIKTAVYLDPKACKCKINSENMNKLKKDRIEFTSEAENALESLDTATFIHEVRTGNAYGTGVKQTWREDGSCTIS